jgi:anti-sigma B factor antagonist
VRAAVTVRRRPDAVDVIEHPTPIPRFEPSPRAARAARARADAEDARERMRDPLVFGALLVRAGTRTAPSPARRAPPPTCCAPRSGVVGTAPGIRTVSSSFYMVVPSFRGTTRPEVLTFTDGSVVPDPDAAQLADIAMAAPRPRAARSSATSRASRSSPTPRTAAPTGPAWKVRERSRAVPRAMLPDVAADGELQVDAALIADDRAAQGARLAGRGRANVLVFPDLDAGNIGYKLVQRLARADAVGPILQGWPGRATTFRAAPAPPTLSTSPASPRCRRTDRHRSCPADRLRHFSPSGGVMSFDVKKQDDVTIIDVEGQLIVGNRQELKQKVLEELEGGARKFLIDFSSTGYIDSSGLGVLVSLSKKIREQGGELRLANLNEDLRTLFELTKLDTLFHIASTGRKRWRRSEATRAPPASRAGPRLS